MLSFEPFSSDDDDDDGRAVVIALTQGNNEGHTSLVYCLEVVGDFGSEQALGKPFRLHNKQGRYIWDNHQLREEGFKRGTLISFKTVQRFRCSIYSYRDNVGRTLDIALVLSQLKFSDQANIYNAVAYRGISEAFPNAEIDAKGISATDRPDPCCALISMKEAKLVDGRVVFKTHLVDENCSLKNNCRNHKDGGIDEVLLPVQVPLSNQNVGSVLLVRFGDKQATYNYYGSRFQAVCEAILLSSGDPPIPQGMQEILAETPELQSYKMTSRPRGKCIIINNVNFHGYADYRYGADVDEEALGKLFEELSFTVDIRKDLSSYRMWDVAREIAAEDHSKFDALFFVVMSHGHHGDTILGVDGDVINIQNLMSAFKPINCPTLANKPKVFIVQACRGQYTESTAHMRDSTLASGTSPQEADFLLAFAAAPGYSSCRMHSGSLFIQILVDVIRQHHHTSHLTEMLTEVTRQVIKTSGEIEEVYSQPFVQVPSDSKSLKFKLYL